MAIFGRPCGICGRKSCMGHTTRDHWTDGNGRDVQGTVKRPRR